MLFQPRKSNSFHCESSLQSNESLQKSVSKPAIFQKNNRKRRSIKSNQLLKKRLNEFKKPSIRKKPEKNELDTLKKELSNLTNVPQMTILKNPLIVLDFKLIGPPNTLEPPDGVVNIDDLLSKLKRTPEHIKNKLPNYILRNHYITSNISVQTLDLALKDKSIQSFLSLTKITADNDQTDSLQKNAFKILPPKPNPRVPSKQFIVTSKKKKDITNELSPTDALKVLQELVDNAVKKHKIFTVNGNSTVRQSLLKRGWIEKINISYVPDECEQSLMRHLLLLRISDLINGLKNKKLRRIYKIIIMSKLIGQRRINFYWDANKETYRNEEYLKRAYINHISTTKFNYSTKEGLCYCSRHSKWLKNAGTNLRVPRTYRISSSKRELEDFKFDFKISSVISLLKWSLYLHHSDKLKLISDEGKVPVSVFDFAYEECTKLIAKMEGGDNVIPPANEDQWKSFFEGFHQITYEGDNFLSKDDYSEVSLAQKAKDVLTKLKAVYPYNNSDGFMNIWILKPSCGSRGIGIQFCTNLEEVLKFQKCNSYVVQKYIEQPFLIYRTKFDIRQWFLISSTSPLTIWIYKECYLKFSSQIYSLKKLHESVHLTNNSIQRKYHNAYLDQNLPVHNMWFLHEFQKHLEEIGHPKAFEEIIYPNMRKCIITTILASQDNFARSCCTKGFELHGADFMLTKDFMPWLLEINCKPALNSSTPVTSVLCPALLEDVIKVIVDHSRNIDAPTGNFELIYQENNKIPIAPS